MIKLCLLAHRATQRGIIEGIPIVLVVVLMHFTCSMLPLMSGPELVCMFMAYAAYPYVVANVAIGMCEAQGCNDTHHLLVTRGICWLQRYAPPLKSICLRFTKVLL